MAKSKGNPNHEPAGTSRGGQFATANDAVNHAIRSSVSKKRAKSLTEQEQYDHDVKVAGVGYADKMKPGQRTDSTRTMDREDEKMGLNDRVMNTAIRISGKFGPTAYDIPDSDEMRRVLDSLSISHEHISALRPLVAQRKMLTDLFTKLDLRIPYIQRK